MVWALVLSVLNASGTESTYLINTYDNKRACYATAYEWSLTIDSHSTVYCRGQFKESE